LGIIDDGVRELLRKTGYPGMKILSFAFNGDPNNLYLPENLPENCVCYTGTHDNDTLKGLIESFNEWDYNNFINGLKNSLDKMGIDIELKGVNDVIDAVIECGMKSRSNLFIVPIQDLLKSTGEYRINKPGSVDLSNWSIKYLQKDLKIALSSRLKKLTVKYKR
jgi:4-alpha-glucanotransferase